MTTTIDVIGAAMRADAEGLRVIGQNIANAQSVAYRREIPVLHPTFDQASVAAAAELPDSASALDLRPGTLQSTANPLHVAIDGKGFFVVATGRGEMLTRRGDFRLDTDGRLVTQQGDPVLGASGPIKLDGGAATILADGTVRVGSDNVGKLRILEVSNPSALHPAENGLYTLTAGEPLTDAAAPVVRQGFLETSNVQTVNEMVQMMETLRRFEAGQHFVRGYDDMLDKTLTTLGRI